MTFSIQRLIPFCLLIVISLAGCNGSSQPPATAVMGEDGAQHARIVVKHGYQPSHVVAEAGKPLKLEFYRDEADAGHSCGEYLDIPEQEIHKRLPARKAVTIEIPPQPAGEMAFQCGMNMMKGKITFE